MTHSLEEVGLCITVCFHISIHMLHYLLTYSMEQSPS